MNLNENPIFLTQKRLVYRSGVLAAVLIAALVGLSLLAGLIAYLAAPYNFPNLHSRQDAGKMFYGWTIGVEILVLVIGGFSRISNALVNERKAGLWDSNRLTPLKPAQLVTGYWFGSPLREFYMAAILAGTGLAIVFLGGLSPTLWLGTQILIFSTALFFGLLAVLTGLSLQKPQGGIAFIALFFFLQLPSFAMPKFLLTNFLLPVYGVANLFRDRGTSGGDYYSMNGWSGLPEIFGIPISPILLSLGLQIIIGGFLWRATIRKTANPFRPSLFRWEAIAIFGILLFTQHGLIWHLWHGQFPATNHNRYGYNEYQTLLAVVHCGAIFLAIIILAAAGLKPENIRVKILRREINNIGVIFSESSGALALMLTTVAGVILLTQFIRSTDFDSWKIYLISVGNLLSFGLVFSLLLEFCRLRHKRRALGFVALWLFVICVLPFILAGVFTNAAFGKLSLLSPGVVALADYQNQDLNDLLTIVAAHFGIVVLLFIGWRRQWKQLLERTSVSPPK